jgi:hypothetical protein
MRNKYDIDQKATKRNRHQLDARNPYAECGPQTLDGMVPYRPFSTMSASTHMTRATATIASTRSALVSSASGGGRRALMKKSKRDRGRSALFGRRTFFTAAPYPSLYSNRQ